MSNTTEWRKRYDHWILYFIYLIVLALSISKHELWGDELHSWNIAKASSGLSDLIMNTRYEGHPPFWYILLFVLTKFTHDPSYMQYLHFLICGITALVFVFRSPLAIFYKALILFGYYFLYEYGVLSRNYSIGILFAFLICAIIHTNSKNSKVIYYCFLFLLSNTHFLALILAISFHMYYLWQKREQRKKILLHGAYGVLILLPALYFILPPSDSALSGDFWMNIWSKDQFFIVMQAPLKALSPVPAWWEYHFWNTHFLLEAKNKIELLKYLVPFASLGLIAASIYLLSKHKSALLFFCCNLALTLVFALFFPLTPARYVGFIFIGLVIALWLGNISIDVSKRRRLALLGIVSFQLLGSFVALKKDWASPFSYFNTIRTFKSFVPETSEIITDYWCLNYLTAALDKPIYCVGFDKERSFLLWDNELSAITKRNDIYTRGTQIYFNTKKKSVVYLVSTHSKAEIALKDPKFFETFNTEVMKSYENTIEKGSKIYIYKISPQPKSQPSIN